MLVSTHNLGSVPEFCDQAVLINRTVLACGPTDEVFTEENLTAAFGGVLRQFHFEHSTIQSHDGRSVKIMTDDERPLVFGRGRPSGIQGPDRPGGLDREEARPGGGRLSMGADWSTPLHYEYMLRAIWVSGMIGGVCGFLSAFVTLKGWSLLGDALSHAVVPGVAVAAVMGWPLAAGAFVAGLLAAGAMSLIKMKSRLREDAVMGVVFTSFFAAGLLIISLTPSGVDRKSIIFGNILAIADRELVQVLVISGVVLLGLAVKWRDLMLVCFDPTQARATGLPVRGLQVLLLVLLSATAVAAPAGGGRGAGGGDAGHAGGGGVPADRPVWHDAVAVGGDRRGLLGGRGVRELFFQQRDRRVHRLAAGGGICGHFCSGAETRTAGVAPTGAGTTPGGGGAPHECPDRTAAVRVHPRGAWWSARWWRRWGRCCRVFSF